jgi:ElaB/YqjD/DUF883 family membrane-anchored ribosome-binding protein
MVQSNASTGTSAKSSFGEQSSKVLHDVQELGSIAAENVGHAATRLKEQGRDTLEAGRERAHELKGSLEKYVADHPMKALLIALGVGAVVGLSLRRS